MAEGVNVNRLLTKKGGGAYPCFKCNEGLVFQDERGDGICNECGGRCLIDMPAADGPFLVTVRR